MNTPLTMSTTIIRSRITTAIEVIYHAYDLTRMIFISLITCCNRRYVKEVKIHYDNDNEYENNNEISLSFSLRFCTERDERLIASISSSTTTITNRNPGITQEMKMSAHTNLVLVLVVVVKS